MKNRSRSVARSRRRKASLVLWAASTDSPRRLYWRPSRAWARAKSRIDLDRANVEWQGGVQSLGERRLLSGAVRLERLEGWRASFLERTIVLLDGGQRFADPGSEGAGGATQGVEDVLLARRLHLFLGQDVAAAAALGAQSQHVLRAEAGDRALEHRAAAEAFAGLAGHRAGQWGVGGMAHQPQRLADALVRDEAEKGRLLQLHCQALSQGVVEHRVAGGVHEISDNERRRVGQ